MDKQFKEKLLQALYILLEIMEESSELKRDNLREDFKHHIEALVKN